MSIDIIDLKILMLALSRGYVQKKDLVKILGLSWPTAISRLDKLVEIGYMKKVAVFRSRPGYVYVITENGIKLLRSLLRELEQSLKRERG